MSSLDIEVLTEVFTYRIWENLKSVLTNVGHAPSFKDLNENEWLLIFKEFLLFEMHLFDRMIFTWYGDKFRNKLFDKVAEEILLLLDKLTLTHEIEIDNKLDKITMASFADYLKTLRRNVPTADWFINECNQRTNEYGKYALEKPEENRGYGGWLFWEFGKRVASLLGRDRLITFIMPISVMGIDFMGALNIAKEALDRRETGMR
jgi:hypothetical protein